MITCGYVKRILPFLLITINILIDENKCATLRTLTFYSINIEMIIPRFYKYTA